MQTEPVRPAAHPAGEINMLLPHTHLDEFRKELLYSDVQQHVGQLRAQRSEVRTSAAGRGEKAHEEDESHLLVEHWLLQAVKEQTDPLVLRLFPQTAHHHVYTRTHTHNK